MTVAGSVPDRKSLISLDAADLPTARLLQNQQSVRPPLFKPAHRPDCADCNTRAVDFCSDVTFPAAAHRPDFSSLLYKRFISLLARSLR
jgi:hypothetical protein